MAFLNFSSFFGLRHEGRWVLTTVKEVFVIIVYDLIINFCPRTIFFNLEFLNCPKHLTYHSGLEIHLLTNKWMGAPTKR